MNARLDASCLISETFLLSSLRRRRIPRFLDRAASSIGALLLLFLFFPAASVTFLFLLLRKRGELVKRRGVRAPASSHPRERKDFSYPYVYLPSGTSSDWWIEFVANVWPGLTSVLKGDLFLVGLQPRSSDEIGRLSSDWQSIYMNCKPGLITEASVSFGKTPGQDELYSAEAYYSVTAGIRHDFKLLMLYLSRMLSNADREVVIDPAVRSGGAQSNL